MFQFPRCPSLLLYIQRVMPEVRSGGFPHSDIPGYFACSRLPETFRSDPRPSSALGAKASTVSHCSFPRDTENTILFLSRVLSLSSWLLLDAPLHLFFLPYSAVKVHQASCCLEAVERASSVLRGTPTRTEDTCQRIVRFTQINPAHRRAETLPADHLSMRLIGVVIILQTLSSNLVSSIQWR